MELRLLVAAVRRGAVTIGVLALLGALLGFLVPSTGAAVYRASATLLVDSNAISVPGAQPFTGDPERYVDDQMRILEGQSVSAAVAGRVAGETSVDVTNSITLSHVTGSNAIEVAATSARPGAAADIANDVVDVYMQQRAQATSAVLQQQRAQLDQRLNDIQTRLGALGAGTVQQSERDTLLSQYGSLLTQRASLDQPGATHDGTSVIDRASVPTAPVRRSHGLPTAAGLMVGALLGAAIAVGREVRRPRVVSGGQAELLTGRAPLAHFPGVPRLDAAAGRRVAAVLCAESQSGDRRVVLVTAAGPGAESSSVAAAVASAIAYSGVGTALLDLTPAASEELRAVSARPEDALAVQSVGFSGGRPLLGEELASRAQEIDPRGNDAARATGSRQQPTALRRIHPDVTVYAVARPASADGGPADTASLPVEVEVVVVHAPPVLEAATAAHVARSADGTVLVIGLGQQQEADLRLSVETLERTGTPGAHVVTARNRSSRGLLGRHSAS